MYIPSMQYSVSVEHFDLYIYQYICVYTGGIHSEYVNKCCTSKLLNIKGLCLHASALVYLSLVL